MTEYYEIDETLQDDSRQASSDNVLLGCSLDLLEQAGLQGMHFVKHIMIELPTPFQKRAALLH